MELIAKHEIIRGPKREIVAPGQAFEATDKEAEELLALGAAVKGATEDKPAARKGGKKSADDADDSVI